MRECQQYYDHKSHFFLGSFINSQKRSTQLSIFSTTVRMWFWVVLSWLDYNSGGKFGSWATWGPNKAVNCQYFIFSYGGHSFSVSRKFHHRWMVLPFVGGLVGYPTCQINENELSLFLSKNRYRWQFTHVAN